MKRSRRELSIDMVIHGDIFKNNQISVIWLFLKINLSTIIPMKRSRRELSIDVVIHTDISKNNQIKLTYFTFIPRC